MAEDELWMVDKAKWFVETLWNDGSRDSFVVWLIAPWGHGKSTFLNFSKNILEINYPIESVPEKITSLSFDKKPLIEGVLTGIKGQYLILDTGVLNIRKHNGYSIKLDYWCCSLDQIKLTYEISNLDLCSNA